MTATGAAEALEARLREAPVIPILRDAHPSSAVDLAARAIARGARVVEVTVETARGRSALRAVTAARADTSVLVGAGTVLSVDDVVFAADAGADFTVAPGFDAEVLRAAEERGMPHLPGVATPSEAVAARRAGATLLKLFPAVVLGPPWLTAMRGPHPDLRFVVTGGIGPHNIEAFLAVGALAAGISLRADADETLDALARKGLLAASGTGSR